MKTLRAVHSIVMQLEPGKRGDKSKGIAAVPPKTIEITPKKLFKAQSQEQEDELISLGAAVVADVGKPDEVVTTSVATAAQTKAEKAAAKKASATGDDDDDDDDDDTNGEGAGGGDDGGDDGTGLV
jgi:hypothetical protein